MAFTTDSPSRRAVIAGLQGHPFPWGTALAHWQELDAELLALDAAIEAMPQGEARRALDHQHDDLCDVRSRVASHLLRMPAPTVSDLQWKLDWLWPVDRDPQEWPGPKDFATIYGQVAGELRQFLAPTRGEA